MDPQFGMLPNTAQMVDAQRNDTAEAAAPNPATAPATLRKPRSFGSTFKGDHGAYFAVMTFTALILSLLSTLSFATSPKLPFIKLVVPDADGNPGGKVKLAVWGWSASGAYSYTSDMRPIGSSWSPMLANLPQGWAHIRTSVEHVPRSLVVAMGIMPIIANIYLFFGFVTAALSSHYFARESYMCHQMARASTILTAKASLWCMISFALYFATFARLSEGLGSKAQAANADSSTSTAVEADLGPVTWLMLAAWFISLYPVIARLCWFADERKGNWVPPAWFTQTKDGPAPASRLCNPEESPIAPIPEVPSKAMEAKEAEHFAELAVTKGDQDEEPSFMAAQLQGPPAPPYTAAEAGRKEELIV